MGQAFCLAHISNSCSFLFLPTYNYRKISYALLAFSPSATYLQISDILKIHSVYLSLLVYSHRGAILGHLADGVVFCIIGDYLAKCATIFRAGAVPLLVGYASSADDVARCLEHYASTLIYDEADFYTRIWAFERLARVGRRIAIAALELKRRAIALCELEHHHARHIFG